LCFLLCAALFLLAVSVAAQEKITFKRLTAAILKIDGKQVKVWDIYEAEKHGRTLLLQLGRRYLLLDIKEREILEIDPSAIAGKPKGDLILTRTAEREKSIASDEWSVRNVGPALAIKVLFTAEGRLLELQVPLRPDERRVW
jgi:hypothetical protein